MKIIRKPQAVRIKETSAKHIKALKEKHPALTIIDEEQFEYIRITGSKTRIELSCIHHPELHFFRSYNNIMKGGCPICDALKRAEHILDYCKEHLTDFDTEVEMEAFKPQLVQGRLLSIFFKFTCHKCKGSFIHHSRKLWEIGRPKSGYIMICKKCKAHAKHLGKVKKQEYQINRESLYNQMLIETGSICGKSKELSNQMSKKDKGEEFQKCKETIDDIVLELEMFRTTLFNNNTKMPYESYMELANSFARVVGVAKTYAKEFDKLTLAHRARWEKHRENKKKECK